MGNVYMEKTKTKLKRWKCAIKNKALQKKNERLEFKIKNKTSCSSTPRSKTDNELREEGYPQANFQIV